MHIRQALVEDAAEISKLGSSVAHFFTNNMAEFVRVPALEVVNRVTAGQYGFPH